MYFCIICYFTLICFLKQSKLLPIIISLKGLPERAGRHSPWKICLGFFVGQEDIMWVARYIYFKEEGGQ